MAEALFVTAAELAELTGRKLKSRQKDWLQLNRIPFVLTATGQPRVARAALLARLGAPTVGQPGDSAIRQKPKFEAIRTGKAFA